MVTIKELPDGLELRSTSWIKLCEEARQYVDLKNTDNRIVSYYNGVKSIYEFIEDHIEEGATFIEIDSYFGRQKKTFEYVIRLKKLDKSA